MKILLIDDHVLFREGIASILSGQPDLKVVGVGTSIKEAVLLASELKPDLILMEFSLQDGTGVDATKSILEAQPDCAIVFLTMHDDDDRLFEAIRSGAKGYMLKNVTVARLLANIREFARGETTLLSGQPPPEFLSGSPPTESSSVESELPSLAPSSPLANHLTEQEIEILRELDSGASNQEIASKLVISEGSVKNHVNAILSKLNLKSRREAAHYARNQGLV